MITLANAPPSGLNFGSPSRPRYTRIRAITRRVIKRADCIRIKSVIFTVSFHKKYVLDCVIDISVDNSTDFIIIFDSARAPRWRNDMHCMYTNRLLFCRLVFSKKNCRIWRKLDSSSVIWHATTCGRALITWLIYACTKFRIVVFTA